MSAINAGTIDANYPTPGVNNNSQGFRNNFASIKNNITIAGNEITDLQNKAIVKAPLVGLPLNNDMANTLISNAAIQGFRHTTYNLGSNLGNTSVIVDLTLGDVQYGVITGNVQLEFAKWAPSGTQSNVEVIFRVDNANAILNLPTNVNDGVVTLDSYEGDGISPGGNINLSKYENSMIHYRFSSIDCGTSVTVEPVDIPRQSQQIVKRIVTNSVGRLGDLAGDVCVGAGRGIGTIQITGGGSGYIGATVIIGPPDVDGGTQATATATVVGGAITTVSIVNAGSGYLKTPTITFVGTSGVGAGATATVSLATTSTNYFYYCVSNYNGTSSIWKRIAGDSF